MNRNNIFYTLLTLCVCLFLILYCILSFSNWFHADDYTLLAYTKDAGIINALIERYNGFCARWSADAIAFSMIGLYHYTFFLPIFQIITLLTLTFSFYTLIKKIFLFISITKISSLVLFLYTSLFTISFFFASYGIAETWFWYVSSWTYLWSMIAGNFLFRILLSERMKAAYIPLIVILTAYIAGAAESYTLIYILLLTALIIVKQKGYFKNIGKLFQTNFLVATLILLIVFYLITLLAPGTAGRKNILTHATFLEHSIRVIRAYGKLILIKTPKLIPYLILFGIPWMQLGQKILPAKKIEAKQLLTQFTKSIFIIGVLLFILILPASWILYELAPDRALSQASLSLTIYSSFVFFYIGYKVKIERQLSQITIAIGLVISIFVLSFHIYNQYSITNKFSKEFNDRIAYLKSENSSGRKKAVTLDALPPSGMIGYEEQSADSLSNACFEEAYGLNFHIAIRK